MKRYLIVSGDSWTDKNHRSDKYPWLSNHDWKIWPEHLAEKLNMTLINLGRSGMGNDYIYYSILQEVLKYKRQEIGLVIAAWSEEYRNDYYRNGWAANRVVDQNFKLQNQIIKTVRNMIDFQLLCESYDVPYKQLQMIPLYGTYRTVLEKTTKLDSVLYKDLWISRTEYENFFLKSKATESLTSSINSKNFIGWPIFTSHGGWNMRNKYILRCDDIQGELYQNMKNKYHIGPLDLHPNGLGHEKIASVIYDKL